MCDRVDDNSPILDMEEAFAFAIQFGKDNNISMKNVIKKFMLEFKDGDGRSASPSSKSRRRRHSDEEVSEYLNNWMM